MDRGAVVRGVRVGHKCLSKRINEYMVDLVLGPDISLQCDPFKCPNLSI